MPKDKLGTHGDVKFIELLARYGFSKAPYPAMKITIQPFPWTAILLILFITHGFAQARNDGVDPSITDERQIQTIIVENDGTFSAAIDEVRLISDERGIKLAAQRHIPYNATLEKIEILRAYTEKPDGRRIPVAADQIKEQQEVRSMNAPMFQDTRVKIVIFPDVAVGDRVALQFKRIRTTPLFPGYFDDLTVPSFHPYGKVEIIYDTPAGTKLTADAKGFAETVTNESQGRVSHRWVYQGGPKARLERSAVSYLDYGDKLVVSTFGSYADIARAYQVRAGDKAAVTPKIRDLAMQIAGKLASDREKALALTEWVRKNIRYVAVYIGAGGVVPHSAESVLENRYGDCKDHAILLEALLSALNIESTGALVNLGNAYTLPKIPSSRIFNHIITYVPSMDLYLDSTAEAFGAGYLPPFELDKPVLLTKSGKIARTPANQPGTIKTTLEYVLQPEGAARFEYVQKIGGRFAELNRYVMRGMKQADRVTMIERVLQARQLKGTGTVEPGDLRGADDPYILKVSGQIDNFAALPGPSGIPAFTGLIGDIAGGITGLASERQRTQEFVCFGMDAEEEASFKLPSHLETLGVPKGISVNTGTLDYRSEYQKINGGILVRRTLHFKKDRATCSPADYEAMAPALNEIQKDLRSQIVVRSND